MPNNDVPATGTQPGVSANVQAPAEFNISQPQQWNQWKKRFDRYISVSGFCEEILLQQNLNLTGNETYTKNTGKFRKLFCSTTKPVQFLHPEIR